MATDFNIRSFCIRKNTNPTLTIELVLFFLGVENET